MRLENVRGHDLGLSNDRFSGQLKNLGNSPLSGPIGQQRPKADGINMARAFAMQAALTFLTANQQCGATYPVVWRVEPLNSPSWSLLRPTLDAPNYGLV